MRSDSELTEGVLGGEPAAFAELVRRHERAVYGVALAVLGDHHTAEDAAQETFVMAYEKLGSLRNGSAFGAWVLRIARRHATRLARRRPRFQTIEATDPESAGGRDGQLDEELQGLLRALVELPPHEQRVLTLKHFDGYGVQAIAQITGRPVGTITKQLSRAYARLRDRLGER